LQGFFTRARHESQHGVTTVVVKETTMFHLAIGALVVAGIVKLRKLVRRRVA
jgi:hypothetical protein